MINTFEQITQIINKILKLILRNLLFVLVKTPIIKPTPIVQPTPIPIPEKRLEFTPKKDFSKPILWKYYPNKDKDIWYPENHRDYIQPDNELVKYFTERIEFNTTTWVGVLVMTYRGTELGVNFIYRIDDGRLCKESGQNNQDCNELQDFWMNPDYYIYNELEGDCEDYSILISCVCERLGLPYMMVGGYVQYLGGIRDWWVEFIYQENVHVVQVNKYDGTSASLLKNVKGEFKPLLMFNKKTPMTEYREWYKDYNIT